MAVYMSLGLAQELFDFWGIVGFKLNLLVVECILIDYWILLIGSDTSCHITQSLIK